MSYESHLAKVLEGLGHVNVTSGESGYFSEPSPTLDPNIFDGDKVKASVRKWILNAFFSFMHKHYRDPKGWATVWLAGSGISYQWSADRGNGDLDVLIGVDFPKFVYDNPDLPDLGEDELANQFNTLLKDQLWPKTAQTKIGEGTYEVTFYVNPHATDIRDINAYAAYNLSTDSWTTRPPTLPDNPAALYPKQFWDQVGAEQARAQSMVTRYNQLSDNLAIEPINSPGWSNDLSKMSFLVDQAKAFFDDIHLGRKRAFGPGGLGYGDWNNFRWQAHKRSGTMQALDALAKARHAARDAMDTDLYGAPLKSAEQALSEAAAWSRHLRGMPT